MDAKRSLEAEFNTEITPAAKRPRAAAAVLDALAATPPPTVGPQTATQQ